MTPAQKEALRMLPDAKITLRRHITELAVLTNEFEKKRQEAQQNVTLSASRLGALVDIISK